MHGFLLDEWAQLGAQGLVRHEIDWHAEQVFEVELNAKVALGCGRTVECDQDIDIAIAIASAARSVACG